MSKFNSILFLVIISFSSCKVLRCPTVKVDSKFEGLTTKKKDYYSAENFIIMHGIGSKETDYSEKIIKRLNDFKFGKDQYQYEISIYKNRTFEKLTTVDKRIKRHLKKVYREYCNDGKIEVLKIKAKSLNQNENSKSNANTFYSINWSVAVQNSKDSLIDIELESSPRYIGVNRFLKKSVMMSKVSDAFGGSQPRILYGLYDAVSDILFDGRINKNPNLNVITGSFGTQIFLGILNEIQIFEDSKEFGPHFSKEQVQLNFDERKSFKDSIIINRSQKLKFYSLTNQLNLMPNNVKPWISDLNPINSKLLFDSVQIVAFRNPNDILCYYMPKETVRQFFPTETELKVINSYYFNWPIRNDVALAHTVVFKSRKLSKIIHYGYGSNWVRESRRLKDLKEHQENKTR